MDISSNRQTLAALINEGVVIMSHMAAFRIIQKAATSITSCKNLDVLFTFAGMEYKMVFVKFENKDQSTLKFEQLSSVFQTPTCIVIKQAIDSHVQSDGLEELLNNILEDLIDNNRFEDMVKLKKEWVNNASTLKRASDLLSACY